MLMALFSLNTGLYLFLSLFIFLLKLFFPIMMSFCRKSVHFLLSLTATTVDTAAAADHHHHNLNPPWKCQALGLVTATNDMIRCRSPNVLESSSLNNKSTSSSPAVATNSQPPPPALEKKDPGGIGFIDDIGGGIDGLMSCTESLGFESSDERRADDDEEELCLVSEVRPWTKKEKWRKRTSSASTGLKRFPPPLSSLNRNGQPSFFLRPVRKDGRLELTEVRIHRLEILRAYRGDGRLRLHFILDDEDEDEDGNIIEEEEEKVEESVVREEEEKVEESVVREDEEERNVNGDEWEIPVSSAGEGLRRCHEVVNHHDHHHHHLQVWRQHCVTTR